jgi:GIY-YIG catalytic domain
MIQASKIIGTGLATTGLIGVGVISADLISCVDFYTIHSLLPIVPSVTYSNSDTDKELVIKENKGKSGIYRWTNLETGKSYIGSSVNLGRRLRDYYNYSFLTHPANNKMVVYKALVKYGYSKFKLEILEYCGANHVLEREQYYLDRFKPAYNLLASANSSLGYRHTKESLVKLRKHLTELNAKKGILVEVTDLETAPPPSEGGGGRRSPPLRSKGGGPTKVITKYESIRKAAEALNSDGKAIRYNEKINKPCPPPSFVFVPKTTRGGLKEGTL